MSRSRIFAALRLAVVPALVVGALFVAWRLGYFDLDRKQALLDAVRRIRETPGSELIFVLVFAAAIALCLPANIGTLLAGAVFGTWPGAGLSLAGTLLASVLAYWLARSVARRPMQRLFGEHRLLKALKEHDGVFDLFRLRVVPIAPFAVLSYVAGLARVSMRRLIAATILGGIPSAVAYSYAGSAVLRGLMSSSDASKRAFMVAGGVTVAMFVLSLVAGMAHKRR